MNRIWVRIWLGMVGASTGFALSFTLTAVLAAFIFSRTPESESELAGLLILLGGGISGGLVSLLVAARIARRLARPLAEISRVARRVSEGDLSARVAVPARIRVSGGETERLLADFNAMTASLERLETERQATTAIIAHELRTPLTVLWGRLAGLRDGLIEFDAKEGALLLQQTELLARLVEDLRTLSLAEAGKLSLDLREVDLVPLVQDVVLGLEPRAAAKGVRLELCAKEAVRATVDVARLHQIVSNLLDNAVRFTPEDGRVQVTLQETKTAVTLSVQDTGPGIAEEALHRVFERFYRADEARAGDGSGLGLAIVKLLVTLHGGQVEASNHPQGGTVLTVSLPRQPLRP